MIKVVNKLVKKQEDAKPAPKPSNEELLLTEIRDILKSQNSK